MPFFCLLLKEGLVVVHDEPEKTKKTYITDDHDAPYDGDHGEGVDGGGHTEPGHAREKPAKNVFHQRMHVSN